MKVPWTIVLPGGLCLGLAALNWNLLSGSPSPVKYEPHPAPAWTPELVETPEFRATSVDIDTLRETLERPLFSPNRRQPKAPEPEVLAAEPSPVEAEQPPQFPPLELKGVLFVRDVRKVLLASPEAPDGQWVGIGDTIMGWDLQVMTPEGATFRAGDQLHHLNLYRDRAETSVGQQSSQ